MTKIKLSLPDREVTWALENERREIMIEITKMMFQDNIGAQGVTVLGQVADMLRKRGA
jgi:hypothetical protein